MDMDERKKKMGKIFERNNRKIKFEKIPQLVKRCPQCGNLSLEFDQRTGRINCTRCGFEEYLLQIKR